MRLWSIHPKYLDRAGLLACWREGLLAKKVLEGNTVGYKNHSQLNRFKAISNPSLGINAFLTQIYLEAKNRGYNFSKNKIEIIDTIGIIEVTDGQIEFEKKTSAG
ncbi:MAG: pyrimidine dimer DNA glycosylase/endonuclease V [Candidatus Gracilibacteria bacterium]|nr:pyrimidine dimer DNA glycosylase/endonuclease V [Candidatus Gracilibacteria bacterium]